ncbi:MAG: DUF2585 domain-containing protein [Hyphomicrobium sp.]
MQLAPLIDKHSARFAAAIMIVTALILLAMGRVPICTCGTIKFWHGVVHSSENSQHLTDWYTFSHVLHGLLFYALFSWLTPQWSIGQRFVAAVAIEAGWEILENTPLIINRYRAATISLDYYGDSVINSMCDIASMMIGFAMAAVLPVWASVAMFFGIEVFMAYMIRDNLTLNVLMLIYPFDAIKAWQGG